MHPEETVAQPNTRPERPAQQTTHTQASDPGSTHGRQRRFWLALLLMVGVTLGCTVADFFEQEAPTPVPTRTLFPTFTPTPESLGGVIIVTPPLMGTPGVIVVPEGTDPQSILPTLWPPPPTPTPMTPVDEIAPGETVEPGILPTVTETESPIPTITETETPTPTPSITPTPFVMVESGLVALRSGPGVEFPLVAQLGPNIPIAITGQNPEGSWYQLCCVNGGEVWVASTHVLVNNDPRAVALFVAGTPPSPTPTFPPTPTGTPTFTPTATPYPFLRSIGPQFFPTSNNFITIWVKLHVGTLRLFTGCDPEGVTEAKEAPAEGYFLQVLFEGFERPSTSGTQPSAGEFACSAAVGAGNRFEYNLKYEYQPPDPRSIVVGPLTPTPHPAELIGTGEWTIFVMDGAGNQLSDEVTFTTQPGNNNREIYVGWERVR
jgi:hypothetical protein